MEHLSKCIACNSTNHHAFVQTAAMMQTYSTTNYNFDRCNDCGLVFLNPRVSETELGAFYTINYLPYRIDEAWGKYASFVKEDQQNIDKARIKLLKDNHKLTNQSRILDVGCGKPTFLADLRNQTSANLIGLDFSDEGWKKEPELYRDIDLRVGEVVDFQVEKPLDVITMWHYLEHDYQPQNHLRDLLRVSHSNTKLIIEVPNFSSYTRRKFGKYWSGYHTPRHTALYSPNNLKVLLQNSGWQVEKIHTYGTLHPYTLHWMSKMEMQQIDWSVSMEPRFIRFVLGMIINFPVYMLQKWFSMGFMTVVAKPK